MKFYIKNLYLLFAVFWMVSSASYSGFSSKWGLNDRYYRNNLQRMLDGTAHKPYVYRQLLPTIANSIEELMPPSIVLKVTEVYQFGPFKYYTKANNLVNQSASYKFKWIIVYWAGFGFLFFSLFVMREILLYYDISALASALAPCILCLSLPIIQTIGGHVYDFSEIFFMSLAVLLTLRKRYFYLLPVAAIATFNKETFLLFILTLYPFLREDGSKIRAHTFFILQLGIALFVNVWIKTLFLNNQGGTVEFHVMENLKNYLNPISYFQVDDSYGLFAPRGLNIINLLILYILIHISWRNLNFTLKKHALIALVINLPLYFLFCATNEIRNLSFLYITFLFLLAKTIDFYQIKESENRSLA